MSRTSVKFVDTLTNTLTKRNPVKWTNIKNSLLKNFQNEDDLTTIMSMIGEKPDDELEFEFLTGFLWSTDKQLFEGINNFKRRRNLADVNLAQAACFKLKLPQRIIRFLFFKKFHIVVISDEYKETKGGLTTYLAVEVKMRGFFNTTLKLTRISTIIICNTDTVFVFKKIKEKPVSRDHSVEDRRFLAEKIQNKQINRSKVIQMPHVHPRTF